MTAAAEISRLRRRRNWAIVVTFVMLASSLVVALPERLARYHAQQQANEHILQQQAALRDLQNRIRSSQADILNLQADIRQALAVGR